MGTVLFDRQVQISSGQLLRHHVDESLDGQVMTISATRVEGERTVHIHVGDYDADTPPTLAVPQGVTVSWSGRLTAGETVVSAELHPTGPSGSHTDMRLAIAVEA
jgi:hypothetical protein